MQYERDPSREEFFQGGGRVFPSWRELMQYEPDPSQLGQPIDPCVNLVHWVQSTGPIRLTTTMDSYFFIFFYHYLIRTAINNLGFARISMFLFYLDFFNFQESLSYLTRERIDPTPLYKDGQASLKLMLIINQNFALEFSSLMVFPITVSVLQIESFIGFDQPHLMCWSNRSLIRGCANWDDHC